MILKKIDIYGSNLSFSLNSQSNIKSTLGGIFTIITILIYLVLLNLMAKDFYMKINPKITSEKVYVTDSKMNNYTITDETFFFAMFKPDYYRDPNLYRLSFYYVEEFEYSEEVVTILDFISCKNTKYSYLFNESNDADEFYCLNLTKFFTKNFTVSTSLSNSKNDYFKIIMEYNLDYLSTLNETYKQELLNIDEEISFFYPQISFSPHNYENPLEIKIFDGIFFVNQFTRYKNYLGYSEFKIEQDENFFLDGKTEIDSKIGFVKKNEYLLPKTKLTDKLATIIIELDGQYYNKFTRVYKKLPEILAQTLGIIQPIKIAISILIEYLTQYSLFNFLINNFLCYFTDEQINDDNNIWKNKNYKDFKKVFKNIPQNQESVLSDIKHKNQKIDNNNNNYNKIKIEKNCNTDFLPIKNNENFSENACYENEKIQKKSHSINEINIELNDQKNINFIDTDNKISDEPKNFKSTYYLNKNKSKNEENNQMITESFSFFIKIKNAFPNIGFKDYYCTNIVSKKKNNYNSKLNLTKILKYFAKEILEKLDLFYYLKLVRTTEILKNNFLRKKVDKEELKFLLKYLYYVRESDLESVVETIKKKSN